jgi:hypothetical protein
MSIKFTNITTENAVIILEVLFNGTTYATSEWDHAPMIRMIAKMPKEFNIINAIKILAPLNKGENVNVDYFDDQCIKVFFTPTGINVSGYNVNHGDGLAEKLLADFKF